jgi:type II secretory pathway pseudopilin PulG
MLAVAIAAVLAVGSLSLFERASARVREQRFTQQVATLAQSVRDIYEQGGAPPYGPGGSVDITARLFALGLGTADGRTSTGFVSAYGRPLTVTTDGPWFTITSLVPAEACSATWRKIPALHGLQINGGSASADLFAPFDAAAQGTISGACVGAGPFSVGYRFQ